jgi:hypothetical protein
MMMAQSYGNSLVGTISTVAVSTSGCISTQHAPCASTTSGEAAAAVEAKKYECPPEHADPFRLYTCALLM